jgi:NAD(P)-dependent dehydrogenase (short-subunit alcohol dehydrogenase family)
VVADIDPDAAQAVAKRIEERGGSACAERTDGTDPEALEALAGAALHHFGAVHLLSSNVGVILDRPLGQMTARDWDWILEFNFLSAVRAVAAFLPHLRAHGGEAHIVHTASMAAVLATPPSREVPAHIGAYTATKHALLGYSEILRAELAPEGIGVSVLCPGLVRSNLPATAARHRPLRYGGPLPEPPAPPPQLQALMMPPERVGPIVVAGIRANRLHIFTHPERRAQVEQRQRRMLEDFDFFAGRAR